MVNINDYKITKIESFYSVSEGQFQNFLQPMMNINDYKITKIESFYNVSEGQFQNFLQPMVNKNDHRITKIVIQTLPWHVYLDITSAHMV